MEENENIREYLDLWQLMFVGYYKWCEMNNSCLKVQWTKPESESSFRLCTMHWVKWAILAGFVKPSARWTKTLPPWWDMFLSPNETSFPIHIIFLKVARSNMLYIIHTFNFTIKKFILKISYIWFQQINKSSEWLKSCVVWRVVNKED